MLTHDDLIDAVMEVLSPLYAGAARPGIPAPAKAAAPRGRPFLSEHDIKKALAPGATQLIVPKDAIISPLAQDWLAFRGILLVRQ
ncbi:MAG: hypothetical protein HY078_14610 [Elusimicrobia bacterium]|nr:hypothetical protein [Elusimicrobiota bacterium]